MKQREDGEREKIRKRERKALMKSLQMAQVSTASMGRFDRKLKNEPDAPKSQTIKKKKSNAKLHELEKDKGSEKSRNLKILNLLSREKEIAVHGHGVERSQAALNKDKMVNQY